MSLSLRVTISRLPADWALFIASYAMPADIAPSPMTAIALPFCPDSRLAVAKPSAAEIDVELCAAPNGSYSLSERFVKPRSEEHTSELQSLMRISYAVFCLKKKNKQT